MFNLPNWVLKYYLSLAESKGLVLVGSFNVVFEAIRFSVWNR